MRRFGTKGTETSDVATDWDGMAKSTARFGTLRRRMAATMAFLVTLGTAVVVSTTATPSGAGTVLAPTQVFASVGASTVNVYTPGTPGVSAPNLVTSLNDGSVIPPTSPVYPGYPSADNTAGSAFDASGNFYVTDDYSGQISKYDPNGALTGVFASGLQNPLSLVFDNSGNLYVGQQNTPYIAEFNSSGQNTANIGPVTTGETGDDWIDLASDQCTFYYTTETNVVYRYSNCAGSVGQQSNFNAVPFPGARAFQVRILPDGGALVADTNSVLRLDSNGNVNEVYPCTAADQSALQAAYPSAIVGAPLPGCGGSLFSLAIDPSGTSFWAGDSYSGNIWQIDLTSGQLMNEVNTGAAFLYGLTVENGSEAATTPTVVSATPTTLSTPAEVGSGNFSTPTPVTATLTNSTTNAPIAGEPVTFTLNGNPSESCTVNTDVNGVATCSITATEPSSTYTVSASFAGDSSTSTPLGSNTSSGAFTVTPDTSSLTYTGPTSAVNGQPITLTGTLTDTTTNTPLPTKVVTLTLGSQSCSGTTDANGNVSCPIPTVSQTVSSVPITATFTGDTYDTPVSITTPTPATVFEPTSLSVNTATSDFADQTLVSGVLTDTVTNAVIPGEKVTFSLNGTETCSAMTDATGTATCPITPGEQAATYTLKATFAGDSTLPLQLMGTNGSANFVVTLEETALSYTGPATAQNGQPLLLSGTLVTDDPAPNTPLSGRAVNLTLGTGTTAQSCPATTTASGQAACTITVANQSPGPIPVTVSFAGDAYYRMASAAGTVNLPEGTQLTINPTSGPYNGSTPVSGTLINTFTNQPVPNEPVTFTLGTQTCTATTGSNGVASCPLTPNQPVGTYPIAATFPGDSTSMPQLLTNSSSTTFTVTPATTTLTYTGPTTVTNGQPATLSGTLTTNEPSSGTDVSGRTVTFTLGTGGSQQSCTAVTNASGAASCTIANVNQTTGTAGISSSFGGDNYYQSSTTSATATVHTPTTLTVSAGTSDFADAGTVSGVLTNSITGAVIPGESVTLTLRVPVVHRDDERQRRGVVLHHTQRAGGHLHARRLVRRRHDQGAAVAGERWLEPLRRDPRRDGHRVHRALHRRERDVLHHVGQSDNRWQPARWPGCSHDARLREHGAELHGHHQHLGERQLHDCPGEPDSGDGAHRGHLRRRRLLPSGQRLEVRDHGCGTFERRVRSRRPLGRRADQRYSGELLGFPVLEEQLLQWGGQRPGVNEGLHRQRARLRLRGELEL